MLNNQIVSDLEAACHDNLATYDDLWEYPQELRSAGSTQERCEACGRPLVISAYGTSLAGGSPISYACECQAGRD